MLPPNYFEELLQKLGSMSWWEVGRALRDAIPRSVDPIAFMDVVRVFEAMGLNRIESWNSACQLVDEKLATVVPSGPKEYTFEFR